MIGGIAPSARAAPIDAASGGQELANPPKMRRPASARTWFRTLLAKAGEGRTGGVQRALEMRAARRGSRGITRVGSVMRPCRAAWLRASANSPALAYRSEGALASARWMTSSRWGGMSGFALRNEG